MTPNSRSSLKHPKVNFRGRFESRFGTDGGFYNRNPLSTAVVDSVVPPGWTWALEGEPDFVPAVGNVPENLEMPVGRVVRLNNPVALRSHAAPVVSAVDSITGDTTLGTETFTTGDPLIGQPVNFGPSTYVAGNNPRNPTDPTPEEFFGVVSLCLRVEMIDKREQRQVSLVIDGLHVAIATDESLILAIATWNGRSPNN